MTEYHPANETEKEILDFMSGHPRVTSKQIAAHVAAGKVRRQRCFSQLRTKGVIQYVGRKGREPLWSILTSEDIQKRATLKRASPEGAMWSAMRTLNVFGPQDLETTLQGAGPQISLRDIQSYCSTLVKSKYLAVLVRAKPDSHSARYRLVKNTGPLPPTSKRVTVLVDPNEDRIVFAQGELQ